MRDMLGEFTNEIKGIGGVWGGKDVYITEQPDCIVADYKPWYPQSSQEDMRIVRHYEDTVIAQKRGMYEFIRYYKDSHKCLSFYTNSLEEIRERILLDC